MILERFSTKNYRVMMQKHAFYDTKAMLLQGIYQ